MLSPIRQQDQFDYAADGRAANDTAYIDQIDSATDEEELSSDPEDEVFSGQSDDLRVEDEDWEIAERGPPFSFPPSFPPSPHTDRKSVV